MNDAPEDLTRLFREAARAAPATRADLARESDYSPETFGAYTNTKPASPAAARALAETLLERGAAHVRMGLRLLRAADHSEQGETDE